MYLIKTRKFQSDRDYFSRNERSRKIIATATLLLPPQLHTTRSSREIRNCHQVKLTS